MLHNESLHYLDHAATTMVHPQVAQMVYDTLCQNWANPSSLYQPGYESRQLLDKARAAVAKTLGAPAQQVFFTGCGTEGNNIAIQGALKVRRSWASNVVVSGYEHPSVSAVLRQMEQDGWKIRTILPDSEGHLSIEDFVSATDKQTALVCCMQVNNEIGSVVDVNQLARRVKEKNPRTGVHVDGVQAWLRMPVSMEYIDSYTVSGHKVHAPKGIGALYLREGYHIQPPFAGGGQEKGKTAGQQQGVRPGTENLAYAVGLAKAAALGYKSSQERWNRVAGLNRQLRQGLKEIPGLVFNSPEDAVPEVLNVSTMCIKSETMLHFLEQRQIYVSSGSACSKGASSPTLQAMGASALRMDTALRISLGAENTSQDIQAVVDGIREGMQTLAKISG